MHFLLHLLGRPHRRGDLPTLRPTPREMLVKAAAEAVATDRLPEAIAHYCELVTEVNGSATDALIRAHLHLAAHEYPVASCFFQRGVSQLLGGLHSSASVSETYSMMSNHSVAAGNDSPVRGTSLERLIDQADQQLRAGRYIRATEMLQRARNAVDTLLSANGGLILADARMRGTHSANDAAVLVPLTKLGDLLLRMLARTHLAANVAVGLRERELRDDLAPWATTNHSVDTLLEGEMRHLEETTAKHPDHAEAHYRLGLTARATGHLEAAEAAFTRVLQLHPHHVLSATRLGATLLQLNKTEAVMPLLAVAYTVPPATLLAYHGLARSAGDRASFARAVERLSHDLGQDAGTAETKANLAFALGELGLLDEERAAWREPVEAEV